MAKITSLRNNFFLDTATACCFHARMYDDTTRVLQEGWIKQIQQETQSGGRKPRYRQIGEITEKTLKEFWSRVDKSGPLPDQSVPMYAGLGECWIWTGAKNEDGYGRFSIPKCGGVQAHRVSFALAFPNLSLSDKQILHRCDNPACIRVEHLFLGTQQDNMDDKAAKGRQSKGDNHPTSKLTDAQVIEIRNLYASGIEQSVIATQFGISPRTVYSLCSPKCKWRKHLPNPQPVSKKQLGSKHHNATLTESQVIEMRELAAGGMSYADIGRRFGVSEKLAWSNCYPGSTKWKHLPNPNSDTKKRHLSGEKHPKAVLTEEQVIEGHRLREAGIPYRKIAEMMGVKHTTLFGALSDKGKAWKNLQPKAA